MADRRTYTDAEKTEALALYETDGPSAVEKKLGIPKNTVASWAKKAGVRTVRNERTREAVEAKVIDGRARRLSIVERQQEITALIQEQLLEGLQGKGWSTLVRGEGGAEDMRTFTTVPPRDAKDTMSALNSSSTIIARLDDQTGDHDDAKSVLADLIGGLDADYERRNP